ncbi:MarR family winged helix-turn-helix transcriptional regulator [Microbispora bryophytorum]|uniref:MarR family transcriptional regulator n=1 Tax=Microbispora bryophytorum TaxID=1460882 RepID=A0A8H9GWK8_9ACTN|nr:MarR family transcriptional regulator [Microbispora bryophytorum]MBD3138944.1 MarR family transcriptional regulator [Microbispora bryophytorum]TQS10195.1 MarR family transcriptional regulator [Microbispora bryophytorum]GGO01057.1 MarR family transcriptional regulator [Microbispora bryophytorum]
MTGTTSERLPHVLDDKMCFALYAASRAVTALYRPLLDEMGLTYPQFLVLLVLGDGPEEGVAVKELGAALHLDYGTMTPLLKRLEANGLVRRQRRTDDERTVQITMTEKGAGLRERSDGIFASAGDAMALEPEEFARTLATLRRLTTNVTAYANRRD